MADLQGGGAEAEVQGRVLVRGGVRWDRRDRTQVDGATDAAVGSGGRDIVLFCSVLPPDSICRPGHVTAVQVAVPATHHPG
eukprot:12752303-Ditylum_brightwellii.AAC.1